MAKQNKVPVFLDHAKKIIKERPRMVAVESKKFFVECFVKGGWTDEAFQKWEGRKSPFGEKVLLTGMAANLKNSIRTLEENGTRVRVGTHIEYAKTHNDGAVISVTAKMKRFWWIKYGEALGVRMESGKKVNWKEMGKTTNAKAEFCKRMALKKVGSKVKIPQRKFIGESKTLIREFEAWFAQQVDEFK